MNIRQNTVYLRFECRAHYLLVFVILIAKIMRLLQECEMLSEPCAKLVLNLYRLSEYRCSNANRWFEVISAGCNKRPSYIVMRDILYEWPYVTFISTISVLLFQMLAAMVLWHQVKAALPSFLDFLLRRIQLFRWMFSLTILWYLGKSGCHFPFSQTSSTILTSPRSLRKSRI